MDGELVVRDLSLRLNGLEGEAAEYLRADQLRARSTEELLLSGQSPITAMELNDATVRVSLTGHERSESFAVAAAGQGRMSGGYPRIELRGDDRTRRAQADGAGDGGFVHAVDHAES